MFVVGPKGWLLGVPGGWCFRASMFVKGPKVNDKVKLFVLGFRASMFVKGPKEASLIFSIILESVFLKAQAFFIFI